MSTYYDRRSTRNTDGTPLFQTTTDRENEAMVAAVLSSAWDCEIRSFGRLAPLDWYAVKDGRMSGVLELKSRSHASTDHPTVFLNVRKWLALALAEVGMGVPAIFVVRFTDGIRWVALSGVDATDHKIAGTVKRVKSDSDIEPVIDVPVSVMTPL